MFYKNNNDNLDIDANTEAINANTKAKLKNQEATTAQAIANKGETVTEKAQAKANLQGAASEDVDSKATDINTKKTIANAIADNKAMRAEQAQAAANAISSGIRSIGSSIATTAKAIGAFLLTDPIGWLLLAAGAIAGLATAIYKYNHRLDESIKKHKELLETQKEGLKTIQDEIDKTKEQTKSLSDLCEQYGNAVEGSSEYYELANKIAELDTSLIIGYTSNGDAILADTQRIEEQIEAYKELNTERLQAKKNQAKDVVNTSATLVNENKLKKKQLDDEILELQKRRNEEQKNVDRLILEGYTGTEVLASAQNAVGYYEGRISEIKSSQEYKDAIDGINDAKRELSENITLLFDEIPEGLSEEELEVEKTVRQFALDIASASEEAMDSDVFLNLFDHLKTEGISEQLSSLFELKDEDIPFEEYQKRAEEIYQAIVDALINSGFEITADQQLALRVAVGIDSQTRANHTNRIDRFVKGINKQGGVEAKSTEHWLNSLSEEDFKLAEEHIEELAEKTKYVSAENLTTALNEALETIKKTEIEIPVSVSLKDVMARSTGKDKTFGDDLDNYTSKINTLEGYLDKLQDGTYTDTDLIELGKEFGIAGSSVNQLKDRISELGKEEFTKLNEQIEEYKKEAEEKGDLELVKGLESIQEASKNVYDQMLETNDVLKQNKNVRSDVWGSKAGMDQLSAIYKDIKDGGEFDWSSIVNNNEFRENFKRFGKEYDDFVNGVFAHPKDIKANQKAFDNLADAYLKAEHILDGLNSAEEVQTKRLLDSIGVINSAEMIEAEQTNQLLKQITAKYELSIANAKLLASEKEKNAQIDYATNSMHKEIDALKDVTQAEKAYYLEKQLAQITDFTTNDIEQLNAIVQALGLGTDAWVAYYNSRARLAEVENQYKAGMINSTAYENMTKGIKDALNTEIAEYQLEISDIASSYMFGGDPADAGTEAADAYLEAFEKELGVLQSLRDSGVISEKEYLDRLQQLYVKYFANKKKYYEQFKKYEKEYLEGMRSLYESAISASITILNDRKEEIEKEKDETIKIIEEQRDSEKKVIEENLDALEDEKEALEKANEEREKALNLQKAQYELERAHSQRTRLIKINVRSYSNIV